MYAPTHKSLNGKVSKEYVSDQGTEVEDDSDYTKPKGEITDTTVYKCKIKPVLSKIIHTVMLLFFYFSVTCKYTNNNYLS